MPGIWPDDLFTPSGNILSVILEDLEKELPLRSGGLLAAQIEQSIRGRTFVFEFSIVPRGRPDSQFKIFTLTSKTGGLPVTLDAADIVPSFQSRAIRTEETLVRELAMLLADQRMRQIYAVIAKNAVRTREGTVPGRDLLLGNEMFKLSNGQWMVHASFFGIGCFLSRTMLEALAQEPDVEGSALNYLSIGRYALTLSVAEQIKMTITEEEGRNLQEAARSILHRSLEAFE